MRINVFDDSLTNSESKIETGLFVKKTYLRTNYIEKNIEEDVDRKTLFKVKNLKHPNSIQDAASNIYVETLLNDPSIIINTARFDFNDKSFDNIRFLKVNSMPADGEHLTAKYYVDQAISNSVDEASLVTYNQNNDFNNFNLTKINIITLNSQSVNDNQVVTKAYVDQFHNETERSLRVRFF